jgi:hypothetical protein
MMNGDERIYIPCPYCQDRYHSFGTNFCPHTGNLLSSNENSNEIRIINQNQICEEVLSILNEFNEKDREIKNYLHLAPGEIPGRKLKNVIKKCKLTEEERVLGIIDLSFRGTAKSCLVFGKKGIYYSNFWGSKIPGTNFIDYRDLRRCEFRLEDKFEISMLGSHSLDVGKFSNSDEVKNDIVDILNSIKGKIIIQ